MAAKDNFFVKNKSIITFLILEVVALTAFNFGNISYIFGLAGAFLAIIGCFFAHEASNDKKELLWLLLPVGILFLISGIGSFNGYSKSFSLLSNISLFLSLPAFLALGYFVRKLDDVKPKTVLFVVGGGLAAITLFGLFSTLFQYGLFYSLIYKKTPNYYYNGIPYDVTKEMFWLSGFEFGEVYIEYGSLFALLSASFLPGLLFISPKKDRNDFIICALIGGIGLLTLLIIPNFKAIIVLVIASAFAFILKFLKNHQKVQKILGISFLAVVGLGLIFFVLALINAATGFKFPGILNRVFVANGIMTKCQPVLQAVFSKVDGRLVNLFGLQPYVYNEKVLLSETNIFEVELLKEVGLVGAFLFLGFVIMMGYFVWKYIKHGKDDNFVKSIVVMLILSFFAFSSIFNSVIIAPHNDVSYNPFLRSASLLVVLFLFGYIYRAPTKEEEKNE